MWTSFGGASVTKRLSCAEPCGVTSRYSSRPSTIFTFAGKETVLAVLSTRTTPISKTPGATSFGALNFSGTGLFSSAGVSAKAAATKAKSRVMMRMKFSMAEV